MASRGGRREGQGDGKGGYGFRGREVERKEVRERTKKKPSFNFRENGERKREDHKYCVSCSIIRPLHLSRFVWWICCISTKVKKHTIFILFFV